MKKITFEMIKVNRVIRYFVFSDLLFFAGWGLIGPIFAIFISSEVASANIAVVGVAVAIYWLTKSFIQIPLSIFLDRHKGEKDDFYVLIAGLVLAGTASMSFLLVKDIIGLYMVVFLQGVAFGLYTPAWSAIFSRHLDADNCSLDWSLDSTAIGIGSGIAAFAGGMIASAWGFPAVFLATSVLSFTSVIILLHLPKLILPKPLSPEGVLREHRPLIG